MVAGSRGDGGAPKYRLSSKMQATIDSVREIVGPHSDSEILAVLRETNMDANETVQRLLYQDPFHEVKRRRDKKKEIAVSKDSSQPKVPVDHPLYSTKVLRPVNRSTQMGGLSVNWSSESGTGREFRIVRDNRVHQNANQDLKREVPQRSTLGNGRTGTIIREKSSSGHRDLANHSTLRTEEQAKVSSKDGENTKLSDEGTLHSRSNLESTTSVMKGVDSEILVLSSSSSGVYASSSDPVHVPSPDSRSAGIVGAIRREVGVVGGRRHSSEWSVSLSSFPDSSFSLPLLGKDISTGAESVGHSKTGPQNHPPASDYGVHPNRTYSSHQYHNKSQANMEWRPKSSQKSTNGDKLASPSSSADKNPSNVEVTALSDKLSESNLSESKHVIIPNHLRVPEADRAGLTFGSFGLNLDSNQPNASNASIAEGTREDQADLEDVQGRNSQSSTPPSSSPSDVAHLDEMDGSDPNNAGNFDEIRIVHSQNASFDAPKPDQMRNPQSLPSFSEAYDPHHSYEVPFFASGMDDGVHGQRLSSPAEASSGLGMMQHQAMMYPQVHLSHYPNFMPYRQILSPMYVPPMAIPSYSNSPAYAHPSSASSYLLMPGATSHLKYPAVATAASQYKPLSYPADDVTRIKFKDSNPYVPTPQADGSEIWIQSQRDLSGQFYGLSSQTPHAAAYLPTAGAPSSHMQFPSMYHHPGQAAQMASSHHLIPAAAGGGVSVGVGMAAPPPQVGSYQQPQVSHLNWTGNF